MAPCRACATPLDFLWLALRAEVGTAVADNYPLNRGAADRAELTTEAVGNLKLKVGGAQCSIGAEVGIHAGTLITNSRPQHLLNRPVKVFYLF